MRLQISLFTAGLLAILPFESFAAQQLSVVNGTHFAILAVQARPHGSTGWQTDLLKQNTLGVGQLRSVALPAGIPCKADFLAILSDGHKVLISGRNVCRDAVLPVTDDRK